MSRDKRSEADYPAELETQVVLRLPEEPARALRAVVRGGETLRNRLTVQMEPDMRNGEVRFDHWLMHAKIVDLPTIVESLKTIDNKSFYKTADICQMMICKEEPDQPTAEEEPPAKNKKKDPYKVDKKFLYPHGIAPPMKNVRKRRFRKTLKKKYVEAPEIEKEVKRLLRADNEAVSYTWEVLKEEEDHKPDPAPVTKPEKKVKAEKNPKRESTISMSDATNPESSNVVDIFGGAVSDSDLEDENINVEMGDSRLSAYDSRLSDSNSMHGQSLPEKGNLPTQFRPEMFQSPKSKNTSRAPSAGHSRSATPASHSQVSKSGVFSSEEDSEFQNSNMSKDNMEQRVEQLRVELETLKQRRQRTQHEISGLENMALRKRFQDILYTLNQDIMYKEMEYNGLLTLNSSEDI